MTITLSANPAAAVPQTATLADVLALRGGQVVEARVVSAGQGSTVQLAINGQIVDAALAARVREGALLQLLVQGSGPGLRLTVLPQPQPGQGQPQAPLPGAQPQRSQPGRPPTAPVPHPGPAAQTPPPSGQSQPQLGATSPQPPPQTALQSRNAIPRPVLVVSGGTGVPQSGAASGPQTSTTTAQLSAGQPASLTPSSHQVAGTPLEPGTVLRLQVQGGGAGARPVLVPVAQLRPGDGSVSPKPQTSSILPAPAFNPLHQAVAQTVQNAVVRQDSIAALLTSLAGLGARLVKLPNSVARAGAGLLAGQVNLDAKPLDGAGLKAALARSGFQFENTLLKSGTQLPPQGDIKSELLALRDALRTWLGGEGEQKPSAPHRPPPPTPGAQPRAERPGGQPLPSNLTNAEAGARLLQQTEAALARMRLVQISSLPDAVLRGGGGQAGPAELNMELPLLFGGELSIAQFQILRDGRKGAKGSREGTWKMRLSINFSQTGEVGATVSFSGGKTGVMLWAEREETAAMLEEMLGELGDALIARGLEPGAIRCRAGHPPHGRKPVGAFMDSCS